MEKEKDDILLKVRSSRGCISAGYRLYTGHFKHIFRYSWLAALIFALFCSVSGALMIMIPRLIPITAAVLVIVECLFASYGFSVLKQHQTFGSILRPDKWFSIDTHIFGRTIKCWLCVFVILLVAAAIISGMSAIAVKYLAFSAYTAVGFFTLGSLIILCIHLVEMDLVDWWTVVDRLQVLGISRLVGSGIAVGMKMVIIFGGTLMILGVRKLTGKKTDDI